MQPHRPATGHGACNMVQLSTAFMSYVQGEERRDRRRVRRLHTVTLGTPLTTALRLLLESGCSSLPVLDEVRHLLEAPVQRSTRVAVLSMVAEKLPSAGVPGVCPNLLCFCSSPRFHNVVCL